MTINFTVINSKKWLSNPKLLIAGSFLLLCTAWLTYALTIDKPAIKFSYCIDGNSKPGVNCSTTSVFEVPAVFFDVFFNQHKSNKNQAQEISVAFPSMRAWRSLSWAEQRTQWKVDIELKGAFSPVSAESFRNIGYPKKEYSFTGTLFGLENYVLNSQFSQVLLPAKSDRHLTIHCPNAKNEKEDLRFLCRIDTYVAFKPTARPDDMDQTNLTALPLRKLLLIRYRYQQGLLPQWEIVQRDINTLIQSFERTSS